MDLYDAQEHLTNIAHTTSEQFHKLPGSAIFLRYVKSSYQNDPIRSAVELFLVLFAIRYLLAPKYSTKPNFVKLSEEVGVNPGTFWRRKADMARRKSMILLTNGLRSHWLDSRLRLKKRN
jgi:hypothetical protein